ncbi:MAG: ATP-dependent acyl-CoA ligase [Gammaproteobacteria bacterium]|nr:MAG: ATP-dependent acyl-CoA ligase [Gammaproteobacteria bacterium]
MPDLAILANRIRDWADKAPTLDILTFVEIAKDGKFIEDKRTYLQLWQNGQKLATALAKQGLKKGDAFAFVMANHAEFVDLMVASSILGTIFVPIDPRTKGDKLRYMLDYAQCKGAVVADYALENVEQAWQGRKDTWLMTLSSNNSANDKGYPTTDSILTSDSPIEEMAVQSTDLNAAMQMLYTSGTTGDPKAILSSHAKFASGAIIGNVLGLTENDRPYTGLSLTHANAQIVTLGTIIGLGLRGVISLKFTKSRLWDITRHYGCTWFNLLGGMTTAIFSEQPKSNDKNNPVRIILSAGMPKEIWADFEERFDVKLCEFYGAAEGGLTFNPSGIGPIGSCGRCAPHLEMKVFNEQDQECQAGEAGEICFRNADGTAPVIEYFKNSKASIDKTRDGWLRMGDIGHVDENGWLYFHFRKGGGIRKNGDFVNTAFVEKALSQHPGIIDVFVYGVTGENLTPGEKDVVAAIEVTPDFNAKQICNDLKKNLEANLIPSYLQVVEKIPKTASEKPQERFLLQTFSVDATNVIHLTG